MDEIILGRTTRYIKAKHLNNIKKVLHPKYKADIFYDARGYNSETLSDALIREIKNIMHDCDSEIKSHKDKTRTQHKNDDKNRSRKSQ